MADQLVLLDTAPRVWKLDQRTRDIGLRGVAEAREALRQATARRVHDTRRSEAA